MRKERDFLGERNLPDEFPFGIHTQRALENFRFSRERIRSDLFEAVIKVKKAAVYANFQAGLLDENIFTAIDGACDEIIDNISEFVPPLHPFQGGAGTSTNMAANELIANMALKKIGKDFGEYEFVSPLNHVNLSQSTNDVYPTAVRVALIKGIKKLHEEVEKCLSVFLSKEKEFSGILKIGRTELQDAMPMSVGQEFGAWAEAVTRFRWRLDKAADWIREVNLSGTAIGTSINADRLYAAEVIEKLRELTREPLSLSRNLVDGTANVDAIIEISGLIKTGAVVFKKICSDIRLLSMGPHCGIGELLLLPLQAGSSIMPGKVNPVIYEAGEQVCLHVISMDHAVSTAASEGNLQLPQFLPYISHQLLTNMELFANFISRLTPSLKGIRVNERRVEKHARSSLSIATLLTPVIGYERIALLVKEAEEKNEPILDLLLEKNILPRKEIEKLIRPEVMASPGIPVLEDIDE